MSSIIRRRVASLSAIGLLCLLAACASAPRTVEKLQVSAAGEALPEGAFVFANFGADRLEKTATGGKINPIVYSATSQGVGMLQEGYKVEGKTVRVTYAIDEDSGDWAGVGVHILQPREKTVPLPKMRKLRIELAAEKPVKLKLRLVGADVAARNAGNYPETELAVTPELKAYTLPLSFFEPPEYAGSAGKTVEQALENVYAMEVQYQTPLAPRAEGWFRVGTVAFLP